MKCLARMLSARKAWGNGLGDLFFWVISSCYSPSPICSTVFSILQNRKTLILL